MTARVSLPTPRDPEVAVVVVTFNAWEWTERALAALSRGTEPVYETIVVDNLSTDGTRERLDEIAGATVVRNGANVGFGAAASQGALLARAPSLVFLNPDALVEPGWLPPLLETLRSSPDVAAVSPRLLHVDGRLQEAGSMVWGEGACDNYGDGDDADRPEYRFRREVDYASAACLLVRAASFAAAGGFDDAFHPAYYEDNDLAMRWREAGECVVYDPRSTAVHRRWASSGDRTGMVDILLRSRAVFMERWSARIGDRPPRPPDPTRGDLTAIRDARCAERLLVLAPRATSRPGLAARVAGDLASARPWWRVTLLGLDEDAEGAEAQSLRTAGVEVIGGDLPALAAVLGDRPGHHTALLAAAGVPGRAVDAVRATQGGVPVAVLADPAPPPETGDRADAGGPTWAAAARVLVAGDARVEVPSAGGVTRLLWRDDPGLSAAALARVLGLAG